MTVVCGVDGCRAGWFAVYRNLHSGRTWTAIRSGFDAIVDSQPEPMIVAVDIPIGLPEAGPRKCDLEARRTLGRRRSSVFPAPIRPTLAATSHAEASAIRFAVEGKHVSLQAWAITPKIREVDNFLRENAELGERVIEVHPELSFLSMNGGVPLLHSKKRAAGRRERIALLAPHVGVDLEEVLRARNAGECERDDVLDAFAAAWTAERLAAKRATLIPVSAETDSQGLTMRITA